MARAVEPFANISAQELLKNTPRLFGWVRKEDVAGLRSVVKVLDWPWRYMILSTGCLYLYKTADDQNFSEAIPLTSFRVCDAPEKSKYTWMFKLIHESLGKTLFFAVDSDFDLKKWKDAITESKIKYCSNTTQEDEADGYSTIRDKVSQTPASPLRAQSSKPRPPAPLPSVKRPYSLPSPPDPGIGSSVSRNTLPLPPRPQPSASTDYSKSKPLPRPPCDPKPRPLTMGALSRSRTESSSHATPAQGFGDVLSQLQGVTLNRSPDPKGPASSSTLSSRDCSAAPGKFKKVNRGNPDGQSFKGKDREGVLPNSALRLDLDKQDVNSLLQNKQGVYIVRKSQSAQSKMALSVWTGDRIRHYVMFHKEDEGYALDPAGPRFRTMEDLIRHYYDFNLPNCDAKFTRPYKK